MAQTGLSSGVADLVSALTGGGNAIQQRAKTAEEMRMMQVQQERALLDERVQKAIGATNQNRYQSEYLGAAPSREDFAAVGGFGADHLASRRAFGVDQQNEARGLAAEIAKIAPMGPDRQNALIGVAGDKLLAPSNVQVDAQAGADIDRILAAAGASNASANSSNATAKLTNAKLPFVGDQMQGGIDLNAAKLANELAKGDAAAVKRDAATSKENSLLDSFRNKRDLVAKQVKAAKDQSGFFSLGAGAETSAKYGPGGFLNQPRQLQEKINGIMSAIGLDSIMELKNASSNGSTGFGALTAPELKLLQDRFGSLSLARTEEEFDATLDEVLSGYDRLLKAMESDVNGARGTNERPPSAEDSRDIDGKRYTKVNGRWMEE